MPDFCDVALPVPLDTAFTYAIADGMQPVIGGRVLVPFRQQRLSGIVVNLHDHKPKVQTKKLIEVLDPEPVLDPSLMRLGKWIADYYLAPLGEVLRTMLPLGAEFKRMISYRIAEAGHLALHEAGMSGSSSRSRKTPDDQLAEFRVLDYLSERDEVKEESLRAATRVSKSVLTGMVHKKWIVREDHSSARDAARVVKVAVLRGAEGKLNANQRTLIDTLAAAGGKVPVETLHALEVPRTTLGTLVKRGIVLMVEEPAGFTMSALKARPSPFDFQFNRAQQEALQRIQESVNARKFSGILLHGVTGSGKTAVYLAGMRSVLDAGRSAILLVPEIGLTPAVAADLRQIFGDRVAILHSALSDQERAEQWHRIKRGDARMVVGTRSAVFAPVSDLALVIVDEEQDSSYKQEETPRYHARDVAVMRAKMANAVVVLGSATPSLESYFNARKNKYTLLELPDRVEQRPLPEVEIIDMRQEFQETGQEQVISRRLAQEIRERLDRKEQVMVLLNRRGYSPLVLWELDLLVGTQMIAKGHDIHGVTLVGVVGADAALGFPDFRAAERTFQLLTQVAGRAGRGQTPGKVILQTYFQEHYAVHYAATHDFSGFYDKELRFRSWMHYPPYSALANVLVRSDKLDEALEWSGVLGKWFEKTRHEGTRVLGPAAAPIVRLKRDYRYHFVLKSSSREKLNALLRSMLAYASQQKIPRTQVIVDVDAVWLM